MRKIQALFTLILPLILSNCTSLKHEQRTPEFHKIFIDQGLSISLDNLFPLSSKNETYLQEITTTYKEKTQQFSVHITLSPTTFKAVAFNDLIGQIYELIFDHDKLNWNTSPFMPKHMKPEYILGDFFITYLPLEALRKLIPEDIIVKEEDSVRTLERDGEVLRKVSLGAPLESLRQTVTLENPIRGYELDIKTVLLP